METILREKLLLEQTTFTDEEVAWLWKNIGHPQAKIRDELVYLLFAKGLSNGWFSKEQYRYLVSQTIGENLIFYKIDLPLPATVTRTFVALLNGMLIENDSRVNSPYFELLTNKERAYFFRAALDYLQKETDFTGFSTEYGWVHGFAHGADFLLYCLLNRNFPEALKPEIFTTLTTIFQRLPRSFVDGEERRLAAIIYKGILSGQLQQEAVATWIEEISFPLKEYVDFQRLASFENFLAAVYFHLLKENKLSEKLQQSLLTYLGDY